MVLLERTMALIAEKGFAPVNCDVTIVAQRPKIGPFDRGHAGPCGASTALPLDCVNYQATTTERLGFGGIEPGASALKQFV